MSSDYPEVAMRTGQHRGRVEFANSKQHQHQAKMEAHWKTVGTLAKIYDKILYDLINTTSRK